MTVVLLTGMSGTGKTSVLHELERRGHRTVDTDDDGWCVERGGEIVWDESRMSDLLAASEPGVLVISGCVSNQEAFRDRIDLAVLLSAPAEVILGRVRGRTNPYGSSEEDRREIARNLREVEPLLREWCDVEFDATRPVSELADAVETRVQEER